MKCLEIGYVHFYLDNIWLKFYASDMEGSMQAIYEPLGKKLPHKRIAAFIKQIHVNSILHIFVFLPPVCQPSVIVSPWK